MKIVIAAIQALVSMSLHSLPTQANLSQDFQMLEQPYQSTVENFASLPRVPLFFGPLKTLELLESMEFFGSRFTAVSIIDGKLPSVMKTAVNLL